MDKKDGFTFTYSAREQEEIKRIREKYEAPVEAEDKMAYLRRLDDGVTSKATTAALVAGILGTLLLGSGMSLIMTEIGAALGAFLSLLLGLALGAVGIVLVALAYPLYDRTLKKEREKIAPEVLRLTDELMK